MALLLLAQGSLDATGRRLAQLVFWLPALVFGGLQLPGPGFVAPALAVYLVIRRLELPFTYPDFRQLRLEAGSP
jgi:hypothetical protein